MNKRLISFVYLYSSFCLFVFSIQAQSAYHGIGLVKLMGRTSGFIAMHASLSSGQIDICLIPEVITFFILVYFSLVNINELATF